MRRGRGSMGRDQYYMRASQRTLYSCTEEKSKVINSMVNMYCHWHARFLGCAQSDAEYCFVQVGAFQERFTFFLIEYFRAGAGTMTVLFFQKLLRHYARIKELERPSAAYLLPLTNAYPATSGCLATW